MWAEQQREKTFFFSDRVCCFIWTRVETRFLELRGAQTKSLKLRSNTTESKQTALKLFAWRRLTLDEEWKHISCPEQFQNVKSVPDLWALCRSAFRTSQALIFNLTSLLLLQICYSVLCGGARARCPMLGRSASVTMATAMAQTVEPTWLPKGNCSSQAASVCVASQTSDELMLARSTVTFTSSGKPCFVLYMQNCMFSAYEKHS